MELRLLGSMELRVAGRAVSLGGPRQRAVVAALALDAGRMVPVDGLVDRVWGHAPPQGARHALHVYIARFRGLLQQHLEDRDSAQVVHRAGGYAWEVDPERIDAHRFRRLVDVALDRGCPDPRRVAMLQESMELWRGPALAGLSSEWAERVRQGWQQRYLDAVTAWAQALVRIGDPGPAVARLAELTAEYPMVESLAAVYIRALYATGRPSDALDHYAKLRTLLVEELGTDPGPELRQLHRQILTADQALARPAAPQPQPRPPAPSLRLLPAPPHLFTGRARELADLDATDDPSTMVVVVIDGMAGVGKTALALHWGHRAADRFPDGQLYINLRGFDPSGAPVEPAAALRWLLDVLGAAPPRIPADVDAQAALYRGLLAGRRVLVILDNARDAEQVRPLLPGSPGCAAVVTSRRQLTGLVAAEGARPLRLSLPTAAEARRLLAGRLPPERMAAEPAAVDELVALCGRLPLALAVVAARAATRPDLPFATLAGELRDTRHRLDAFDTGDVATDLRAVFSWSYRQLSAGAARLLRLLGLHPGPDVSVAAAASLTGVPSSEARSGLAELAQANLVAEPAPGRYDLHDLLRTYAYEQALARDPEYERRAAVCRMLDHYLQTSYAAAQCLDPHRGRLTLPEVAAGVVPERVTGHDQAMTWLAAEWPVLLGAVDRAVAAGLDVHAWQLAWCLSTFLERRGHWHDWLDAQRTALAATLRLGDRMGQASSHNGLGLAHAQLDRLVEAHHHYLQALRLFRELGNHSGQASAHMNMCWIFERRGRHRAALAHARRALAVCRATGNRSGQADALNNIGWYLCQLGDYEQALVHCRQALAAQEELGDRQGEADAWDSIGFVHYQLDQHREAIASYQRAVERYREVGDRYGEADVLVHLGDAHRAAGDRTAARHAWQLALEALDELGHPDAAGVLTKLQHLELPAAAQGRPDR